VSSLKKVILDGSSLKIEDVVQVARENVQVEIAPRAREEICRVRQYIEEHWMTKNAPTIYGFNTGVGKLKDYTIGPDENDLFQTNIILSHSGCVGEPTSEEVVRATMLVRINAFCQGVSGLRIETIDRLLEMLNCGVHPVVPLQGSVGASGDLGPLAHIMAVMIGHEAAEAFYRGKRMPARQALQEAGMTPVEFQLKAKDALALINGTTMFAAYAALNCYDALSLARQSDVLCALSLEAVRGELGAFDERIQKVRRHNGQQICAENIRRLVEGSTRTSEEARKVHLANDVMHPSYQPRVQDIYSLRCAPQVHGAVRDNLDHVIVTIEREINAATDNPLVFWNKDGELEFRSGGNFHGEPVAFAMDLLAIAMTELGNISERRIFFLCDPTLNYGLPPMLAGTPIGLNCGYNIISCSAAAITSENKTLCFPAVADNIPTKSSQEDHVSMAPWATRKANMVLKNLEKILGIETLIAAQAISITEDVLGQFKLGKGTDAVYKRIRQDFKGTQKDEFMWSQSAPCQELSIRRTILKSAEEAIGNLK
jgi:histidine ammonia-lyase